MSYNVRPQHVINVDTSITTPRLRISDSHSNNNNQTAFRNITSESQNTPSETYTPTVRSTGGGFLPVKSSDSHNDKLTNKLYGTIEAQEGENDRLRFQYNKEKKRREELEEELKKAREEAESTKKRFENHRKQEREFRNKTQMEIKERNRDDIQRWENCHQQILRLQAELEAKSHRLAEFESRCTNLQETLDRERKNSSSSCSSGSGGGIVGSVNATTHEVEKRLALTTQILETCCQKLGQIETELQEERKMKQILIKINDALQTEIQNLKQQQLEQQQQQRQTQNNNNIHGALFVPSSSTLTSSFNNKEEQQRQQQLDEHNLTHDIVQDLQIEDALFYFEKVRAHYAENQPKVYSMFLEIIHDYKTQKCPTPEVIARISKLFMGNTKLIVGFNQFLPKEFHISEHDVADMHEYHYKHHRLPEANDNINCKGNADQNSETAQERTSQTSSEVAVVESTAGSKEVATEEQEDDNSHEFLPEEETIESTAKTPSKAIAAEKVDAAAMKRPEEMANQVHDRKQRKKHNRKSEGKSKESREANEKTRRRNASATVSRSDVRPPKVPTTEVRTPVRVSSTNSTSDPMKNLSDSATDSLSTIMGPHEAPTIMAVENKHEKSTKISAISNKKRSTNKSGQDAPGAEATSPSTITNGSFQSFKVTSAESSNVFAGVDSDPMAIGATSAPHTPSDRYDSADLESTFSTTVEILEDFLSGNVELVAESFLHESYSVCLRIDDTKSASKFNSSTTTMYESDDCESGSDSEWWDQPDGK